MQKEVEVLEPEVLPTIRETEIEKEENSQEGDWKFPLPKIMPEPKA